MYPENRREAVQILRPLSTFMKSGKQTIQNIQLFWRQRMNLEFVKHVIKSGSEVL